MGVCRSFIRVMYDPHMKNNVESFSKREISLGKGGEFKRAFMSSNCRQSMGNDKTILRVLNTKEQGRKV